ncbi:MAG: hypothetical protein JW780_06250 [Clostridiales bacterium]|nr:hypothetical protein [Clostridiales bacterium]
MKTSGKHSTLLFIVLIALVLLGYIVLVQNPESKRLKTKNDELATLQIKKQEIDQTIMAGQGLSAEIEAYKEQIAEIEQKLLPSIETQIIAQKLQDKFVQHNIPFITKTNTEPMVEYRVLMPDGTKTSPNLLQSVLFYVQVCGTDGVNRSILDEGAALPEDEEAGYKVVGYEEFIDAVKDIEDDYPDSVKIKTIGLEDSGQGFMYYNLAVVVYSYYLPDRITEPDMSHDYLTWSGTPTNDIEKNGLIGIPYNMIPEARRDENTFRPFALDIPELEEPEEPLDE